MPTWKDQLGLMLHHHQKRTRQKRAGKEEVQHFLHEKVAPALQAVGEELSGHGRTAELDIEPDCVSITVYNEDEEEFYYAVKARTYRKATFAFPEMTFKDDSKDTYHRAEVYLREGSQDYGIMGFDREHVIANFMHEYDKQLRWQKPTKGRT
jgi:choline/glycine/proline betaine transport protein